MDWNDRRLRWMPHFPHHAHVDVMTNAKQQWGVTTTSFSSDDEFGEEGGSCHTTTNAQMTHGHILWDDLLNQIACHLHDSQSFPKFLTLGSKNNHKPMCVTERLFLQRNYPNMRFSDEIGVMPMHRISSRKSDNNRLAVPDDVVVFGFVVLKEAKVRFLKIDAVFAFGVAVDLFSDDQSCLFDAQR